MSVSERSYSLLSHMLAQKLGWNMRVRQQGIEADDKYQHLATPEAPATRSLINTPSSSMPQSRKRKFAEEEDSNNEKGDHNDFEKEITREEDEEQEGNGRPQLDVFKFCAAL